MKVSHIPRLVMWFSSLPPPSPNDDMETDKRGETKEVLDYDVEEK